ncbi:TPA: hypothetical protein RMT54_005315 [Escherichia coli]|nr:hypothetical protein [Escherichia coli]
MINEVKKMAVEMMFWLACPVDDDNCFDAIMQTSEINRAFEDKHAIYLHPIYRELCSTEDIKRALIRKAIKLIAFRYDIDDDSARKIFMKSLLKAV